MELKFRATILQNGNMDAAYVEVPYDIKELFGKGRLLVNATFDGIPYRGQVVKMGTPCYIIGVTRQIRRQIGKSFGDTVEVVLQERDSEEAPLWKCPKCGKTFQKKGQSHFCGEKPENIDAYSNARIRINRRHYSISVRSSEAHCRKRKSASHGVCQLTGKSTIFFTLPHRKDTLDCIITL